MFYWYIQNAIKDSKVHYQNPFQYIKVRSIVLPLGLLFTGLLNQSKLSVSVFKISDPTIFGQVSATFLFVMRYCSAWKDHIADRITRLIQEMFHLIFTFFFNVVSVRVAMICLSSPGIQ